MNYQSRFLARLRWLRWNARIAAFGVFGWIVGCAATSLSSHGKHSIHQRTTRSPFQSDQPPAVAEVSPTDRSKVESEGEAATDGEAAMEERSRRRGHPTGAEWGAGLLAAKAHAEQMSELQAPPGTREAGIWNWSWLGPGNIGGRIRSIVIHPTQPTRIWIGAVAGGIWKTENAGQSWTPVADFLPSLAVSSMAIDPTNPNIMYAGTGEFASNRSTMPGAGIFKSVDGGQTWNQLENTSPEHFGFNDVTRIAVSPDGGILLAPSLSGINRSTDGGVTWTRHTGLPVTDVEWHPTDPMKAIAGSLDGKALFTIDGGLSWTTATGLPDGAQRVEVAYARSSPSIVYASVNINSGELWRSTNGGASYSRRNTGNQYFRDQGNYDNALWVAPNNSNHVVVGGIDLWRSTDGGTTLTKISDWFRFHLLQDSAHADQHVIIEHPGYDELNHIVYVGNDGGIQRAVDILSASDDDWTNLANGLGITQYYWGAASSDNNVVLAGSQDNSFSVAHVSDGPNGWVQPVSGDGGGCAIDPSDSEVRYATTNNLSVWRTYGLGIWLPAGNGITDAEGNDPPAPLMSPLEIAPSAPDRLVAGGVSIWATSNRGDNWREIRAAVAGQKCRSVAIYRNNSNFVWVGYSDGRISRTSNAFATSPTWSDEDIRENGTALTLNVNDIAIDPSNEQRVYAALGNTQRAEIWYTEDSGDTWELRNGGTGPNALPAINVNCVAVHPNNPAWIYVGTDLGVYASEDRGLNWSRTPRRGDHEGPLNTEVQDLFFGGDSEWLYAATHGRGMYRTRTMDVVYVSHDATGHADGSQNAPFPTIQEGIAACGNGSTLSIKSGFYFVNGPPSMVFDRRMTIVTRPGVLGLRVQVE